MSSTDRTLIGTRWIKVSAKHHGQKGIIDAVSGRGVRLHFVGRPTHQRHGRIDNQRYLRLSWPELGNNWQPYDKRSQEVYDNWAQKVAIQIAAEYKMTESEEHIVPEIIQAIEETVECQSQYHSGSRTVLKSQTYLSRNDRAVCFECKAKVKRYMENKKTKEQIEKDRIDRTLAKKAQQEARNNAVEEYVPPVLEILPVESLPQWRVTVVEPTVHYIYAKDFLDAASQVSGNGEIIRIEKV